jgi:hypothetical protein
LRFFYTLSYNNNSIAFEFFPIYDLTIFHLGHSLHRQNRLRTKFNCERRARQEKAQFVFGFNIKENILHVSRETRRHAINKAIETSKGNTAGSGSVATTSASSAQNEASEPKKSPIGNYALLWLSLYIIYDLRFDMKI